MFLASVLVGGIVLLIVLYFSIDVWKRRRARQKRLERRRRSIPLDRDRL